MSVASHWKIESEKEIYMNQFKQLVRIIAEQRKFRNAIKKRVPCFVDGFVYGGNLFHRQYNKVNALDVAFSDDRADVLLNGKKYHVGEDGKVCYLMSVDPVGVVVSFNRSCYVF